MRMALLNSNSDGQIVGAEVRPSTAQKWIENSLEISPLAGLYRSVLNAFDSALLLIDPESDSAVPAKLDNVGGRYIVSNSDRVVERFIRVLAEVGVRTLIVDDDASRRGDPHLGQNHVFVGDRVLWWVDLREVSASAAVTSLREHAAYWLNAYACWGTPEMFGFVEGAALSSSQIGRVVERTSAILSWVFDNEATVAMLSRELTVALRKESGWCLQEAERGGRTNRDL